MPLKGPVLDALSEVQRRRVRENLGLVGLHLRKHVRNLRTPRREREWEDLFQEGCLGLIRAAVDFAPEREIPFAAFALPRIHHAVSLALQSRFTLIRPPRRKESAADAASEARGQAGRHAPLPRTSLITKEQAALLAQRIRPEPDGEGLETIGERVRGKYERAVRAAAAVVVGRASTRGDRVELVRVLTEERFLIPQESSRRGLRQIARDTNSSFARVSECERRISEAVREALTADPEFDRLERLLRTDRTGSERGIDRALESELAAVGAKAFIQRFRDADRAERARLLEGVLEVSTVDLERIAGDRFAELPSDERERLLHSLPVRAS